MKYYTYVLKSEKDNKYYYGFTKDLIERLKQHNNSDITATKYRTPLKLVYYEVCFNKKDALKREKYFKTHHGKMFLKNRLKNYLNSFSNSR
ncbi:MAG: putative endonuclease [Candidatus Cloacimonadota bacterium]|jgi:putative endonuclease|nr:putative endonuclease [Candidatus Cloacimonadota bacterium]